MFGSGKIINKNLENRCIATCKIPGNLLNDAVYYLNLYISNPDMKSLYTLKEAISFEVKDSIRDYAYYGKIHGVIRPKLEWEFEKK